MTTDPANTGQADAPDPVVVLIEQAAMHRNDLNAQATGGAIAPEGFALVSQTESLLAIALIAHRRLERSARVDALLERFVPLLGAYMEGLAAGAGAASPAYNGGDVAEHAGPFEIDSGLSVQVDYDQLRDLVGAISGVLSPLSAMPVAEIPQELAGLAAAFYGRSWGGIVISGPGDAPAATAGAGQ